MHYVARSLFQYVFDACSLIYIERNNHMRNLRRRCTEVILPAKVAEEVQQPGQPLTRFLDRYPDVVCQFTPAEENRYLEIRGQPGIDDGEAAAITLALSRDTPLVIDDQRGRAKAENHGLRCLGWQDWVEGY